MVCLRNICINALHKGDNNDYDYYDDDDDYDDYDDDDDDDNNNNNSGLMRVPLSVKKEKDNK